jgi:hypothetical protein
MYCKWQQDVWIRDYFGQHVGRCLEIGARNGLGSSQTLNLIESNWQAVLVEPHSINCRDMCQLYESRGLSERTTVIQAAIVPESHQGETITMYDHVDPSISAPSACSSIDPDWARDGGRRFAGTEQLWETEVPCLTVCSLLDQVGLDFDFVTIDAEGQSLDIARAMPWERMPTKLLTIEGGRRSIPVLAALGWTCREIIDCDLLLTR